ncbi:substrate-binding domain-containing protein [Amycolatopsis cihanbeyliensis]|uniref:DNA-binding LacI/PurR family transcriptional regulator n=1 Tax=Amycolatopsis cihanbeyliensis TaxID=1128664 RepID=A0A542DQ48_AMYCI|nr:substrate-binding domain-containing protein [Amycolatopsis cihanbeyliensis]TQJ05228.1 DNA-binding LacI/PurR family transcriptional regulator [Amycolatopsis cihanbeyliensis]
MRESGADRRQRILAMVETRGEVRVTELAAELGVSVVTARRDVEDLARAGRLRRGHGVARSLVPARQAPVPDEPSRGVVALVVPERHAYLNEVVHGARAALEEASVRVVLHPAPQVAGAERPIVQRVLSGEDVRGLLIAPRWRTAADEEADDRWLADVDVPLVLMEREPRAGSALHSRDSVYTDHWYGMRLAVEHLVSLGHRRLVLAARDDSPTARALRAAFATACQARPQVQDWAVVLSAPDAGADPDVAPHEPSLAETMRERGATGVIMHGDIDALILVQRLAEAGLAAPRDYSVVAYDDVVASLGSPPLTAVAPAKAEVGRLAAELLLERLGRGPAAGPARRVAVLPELTVRTSARMNV